MGQAEAIVIVHASKRWCEYSVGKFLQHPRPRVFCHGDETIESELGIDQWKTYPATSSFNPILHTVLIKELNTPVNHHRNQFGFIIYQHSFRNNAHENDNLQRATYKVRRGITLG